MNSPQPLPSDRSFGFTFVVVFALLAALGWWRAWAWAAWPTGLALLTLATTLTRPQLLRPLNRQWMRLAALLHRIVSPIMLGAIFYGIFTPVAAGMRIIGRDAMRRRFEPAARTYWVERSPPGPDPKSLPDQF
jgi:Saxitoxin biosynthesis operon protein SxtJ